MVDNAVNRFRLILVYKVALYAKRFVCLLVCYELVEVGYLICDAVGAILTAGGEAQKYADRMTLELARCSETSGLSVSPKEWCCHDRA